MGKGVWNPATGGLVQIDTEAEIMETSLQEADAFMKEPCNRDNSNFYLILIVVSFIGLVACVSYKVYLKRRGNNNDI